MHGHLMDDHVFKVFLTGAITIYKHETKDEPEKKEIGGIGWVIQHRVGDDGSSKLLQESVGLTGGIGASIVVDNAYTHSQYSPMLLSPC
ncbi:hypothetical protein NPIL_571521 [Nephila pilipes]|uniref:Uncharacterized protein n=1 Tax=Nephila pilipes TaxID=299642 RepID=A0A8X6R0J7_NEPPI|nr:hypothetical protein NPIL_571521 [Nephila pilipes]